MSNETPAEVLADITIKPTITREEAQACQRWAGMDGATAWHLIDRHADNWADVGLMMDAWLEANRSLAAGKVAILYDRELVAAMLCNLMAGGSQFSRDEISSQVALLLEAAKAGVGIRAPSESEVIGLVAGPAKWHHKMNEIQEREAEAFDRCREITIANIKTWFAVRNATKTAPPADPAKASEPEYDRSVMAKLADIWRVLDRTLGDTDPCFPDYISDDEIRDESPVWWATRELRNLIDNADAAKVRTVRGSSPNALRIAVEGLRWVADSDPDEANGDTVMEIRGHAQQVLRQIEAMGAKASGSVQVKCGACDNEACWGCDVVQGKASGSAPDGFPPFGPMLKAIAINCDLSECGEFDGRPMAEAVADAIAWCATPPASAPEVTKEFAWKVLVEYYGHGIAKDDGDVERMRAIITAALQQEGKSHG